jgi:hypothetical protein
VVKVHKGIVINEPPILYLNEGYDWIVVIDSGVAGLKD